MDLGGWLRSLGLERYEAAFRENEIDDTVLPSLTAEDLKDLGVGIVGHRRKLLDAIAALRSEADAKATPSAAAAAVSTSSHDTAERRQLTVMFTDLVGSTALSTRLDPEDLRTVIGAYHKCVAETVTRFGGFVAKYMGDGVLVYFGYPQAHEDDAERAVRAGLALTEAVGKLGSVEPLQVRIGAATGMVVVGDLVGSGEAQERGVVGETPNLAARLEGLAAPSSLVIADATRRQLGGLFDLRGLGPRPLAGFAKPQRAWLVVGEAGAVSRFEALRSGTTPLVGRAEELDLLCRRWEQAKASEGRVVLISGEPGIGKSRLTAAVYEMIENEPHTRLRWFCSPHHQDSALYPTIVQLERAASFAREDDGEARRAKLRDPLHGANADEFELIAELLSLPNAATDLSLSPQRKRERLFDALLNEMETLSRRRPVLAIFEDAHWIDPTSRQMLDLMVDRVRRMPVLLIVTFRPEFQQSWVGQPHVTMLALNRLDGRHAAALVLGLARNAPLGSEVVQEIAERADGVPLFVEELTKAILERAEQDPQVEAVLSASPLPALAVPFTLHASLIARLDRIGPAAKEVAQICSVLGREFTYELIERVAARSKPDLNSTLAQLTEAGLLFCRGVPPESAYLFKHALVQDAAYSTLLRARRQELHARVAATLERYFADLVERQPEILAHHLTGAGANQRAVEQWLKTGQFAAARSTHLEAIRHFERGLTLLASLPEGPTRDEQEIELQLARGLSLFTTEGFISNSAAQAYTRARELAERHRDARRLVLAIYGEWQGTAASGRVLAGIPLSRTLLELTNSEADSGLRLQAHHSAWTTCLFSAQPIASREHSAIGRRLYDPEQHRSHRLLFGGHDPGVCARNMGAQAEWQLGYPDTALVSSADGLALAERIGHPLSLEMALMYKAQLHVDRGELESALALLASAESLVAEQRLAFVLEPQLVHGAALLARGATEDAIASLQAGLRTGVGGRVQKMYGLVVLADALLKHQEAVAALAALKEAREVAEVHGLRQWQAEIHRIEGMVLLYQNKLEEAQREFEEALRFARERNMKGYELRAAIDLARLWAEQDRPEQARELLRPIFGWFTEGFDTRDLKEAKALLDELT